MASTSSRPSATYSISKLKLDSLFLRWFSLKESQELVRSNAPLGELGHLSNT